MTEISELGLKKDSLNASLSESKNLFTIFEEKRTKYNNFTDEERSTINKLLPDSIDNVTLVIDIDDIASKYSMKIRNLDLKTERAGEGEASNNAYGVATLRFAVSAPYERFSSFLNDLEDSLRIMDISSLSFNSSDKDVNEYNVELKTYWLKETI